MKNLYLIFVEYRGVIKANAIVADVIVYLAIALIGKFNDGAILETVFGITLMFYHRDLLFLLHL